MRKAFIIMTGIYLSLVGLLLTGAVVLTLTMQSKLATPAPLNPWQIAIFNCPFLIWVLTTAIGLFCRRDWARLSLLVMSGFAVITGIVATVTIGLLSAPATLEPEPAQLMVKGLTVGFMACFLIVLPVSYFIIFTRPKMKELFIAGQRPLVTPRRPLGMMILILFSLFGVVTSVGMLFQNLPLLLFGMVLNGWMTRIFGFLMLILNLYIIFGFWKTTRASWYVYLTWLIASIANVLTNIVLVNDNIIEQLWVVRLPSVNIVTLRITNIFTLIVLVVLFSYIYIKRKLFLQPPSGEGESASSLAE